MSGQASAGSRVAAIIAVVALAIGVGALAVLAVQRASGSGTVGTTSPAPSFTFGDLASGSPTPSGTAPTGAPAAGAAADERFIAVMGAQMWRGTAGSCGAADVAATPPIVEYSTDGGSTWSNVTPADARQVLNVAALGDGEGEVIAATGDACTPTALRTYTSGRAWESYPDVLATSTYVSPTDRASVVAAGAAVTAPCGDARSARASRGQVAIVCDGTAFALVDGAWTALGGSEGGAAAATAGAIALDAVAGTVVVASSSTICGAGAVDVVQYAGGVGTDLGCIANVDAALPAALSMLDSDLVLWTGDSLLGLD